MIRFRRHLERIEPYRAGRPAEAVARERGLADVVKLASNECPYPPLPPVLEAIALAAREANRYPDDDGTELREALADHLGLGPERIALGCGSIDVCLQAVLATVEPGGEVLTGWPTFNAYPLLVDLVEGALRTVPLRAGRYDLSALAEAVDERTRLVIVCNPNNPTGTAVTHEELAAFLDRVPDDLLVVVDEAYVDFVDDRAFPDSLALLGAHDNLLVLRTFSKAHGLAGLRIGYGLSSAEVVDALRKVHVPFAVGRVAQTAALASLGAAPELAHRIQEVRSERRRLARELSSLGFAVSPTQTNFLVLPLPGRSQGVAEACEARGVIVRPLGPDLLRVTVGTPRENDRFLAVLAEVARPPD